PQRNRYVLDFPTRRSSDLFNEAGNGAVILDEEIAAGGGIAPNIRDCAIGSRTDLTIIGQGGDGAGADQNASRRAPDCWANACNIDRKSTRLNFSQVKTSYA